jgi:hypothetical protein
MTTETTHHFTTKRIILLIIVGLLLLILLWFGLKTWRLYQVGQSLLSRQAEVETLIADGLTHIDPDTAEALVMKTREDIKTLKRETAVFMPITPYLGWIPKLGPTLINAPALMTMADSSIDAAAYAVRGLKPALAIMQDDTPSEISTLSRLSSVLVDANPDLVAANEKLTDVAEARANITNVEDLPWQLEALFAQADEWLPFAQDGLQVMTVLPEILGKNSPKTYLIIAQNEDELRPTGGFISSAGTLVVENGAIASLDMVDAYYIDSWQNKPYDFPPQPFYDYMGFDLLLFRDANFWPDFPTSAEKLMDLYSYGQDLPPLDGVIAMDQEFIDLLVEATGPIYVPEDDVTITPQNVKQAMQDAWGEREENDDIEWVINRKAFVGVFGNAMIDHIQNNFSAVDPITLAKNIKTAVAAKHLQIYLRDTDHQATLDQVNWDGRLENLNAQDFLAVVDTNMGFTKANLRVNRALNYHIGLDDEGAGEAELEIIYSHTGQGDPPDCIQYEFKLYTSTTQYNDLTDRCYWNYLRVYVPSGSQLISGTENNIPAESMRSGQAVHSTTGILNEHPDFTTWDNFMLVPYGQSVSTQYQYSLPQITTTDETGTKQYQLTIRKQAGTRPDTVSIAVTLPDGTALIDATPNPSKIENGIVFFDIILDSDKNISVTYQ